MKFLIILVLAVAWTAEAKETAAADCKYLLMQPQGVRESVRTLIQTPAPQSESARKELAVELRAAANVLLGHSTFGDADVKKAFEAARQLTSGSTAIKGLYPLIAGAKSIANFKTTDLGPLTHRFSRLAVRAFPIYRSDDMEKPIAYATRIILDVGADDTELFSALFNGRAFLHESISASLKSHREDFIEIGASLLRSTTDKVVPPGRMKAIVISPVVTDAFAYTHTEFRRLSREHQDFLSFFEDMKNYPDEVVYEVLHMIGIATERTQFEN